MNYGATATIKKRNEPNARFWAAAGRVDDPRARLLSVRFARKRKSQAPGGSCPFAFMHLMALHESVRRLPSYSGHGEMNELWSARYYKKRNEPNAAVRRRSQLASGDPCPRLQLRHPRLATYNCNECWSSCWWKITPSSSGPACAFTAD